MSNSFFDPSDDVPVTIQSTDVTQILSASSYPHTQSEAPPRQSSQKLMYGGIVATRDSTEEDEVEEEDPRPRKRSRPTKTKLAKPNQIAEEAPKRQRGRPKVSPKDETAAERRRTQIRLAQRAYRNRKENTITDLTQRVDSLEATLMNLNAGFTKLHESLLIGGLMRTNSNIANQVEALMQQFSTALEVPPSDGEKASDADDTGPQDVSLVMDRESQNNEYHGHMMPVDLPGQTHLVNSAPDASLDSFLQEFSRDHDMADFENQNLTDFQMLPAFFPTSLTASAYDMATGKYLDPRPFSKEFLALTTIDRFPERHTYTYSFQEVTFARRLHRLCMERSYQRLLSAHVSPEWLFKKFKFTLNFANKERIIETFKRILSRGTDEPLENWKTPFINIGGAGTHFPRRDANGNPFYPPNLMHPQYSAGVFRLPNTTTTTPIDGTLVDILEDVGFGGEWFDSHDVEEYLKTMGIFPDPQASFVVVDSRMLASIPLPAASDVDTLTSCSSPQSSVSIGTHSDHGAFNSSTQSNALDQRVSRLERATDMDDSVDSWLGRQQTYFPDEFDKNVHLPTMQAMTEPARMIPIEIDRFLERLSDQGVCLGRAPGFRKEHVDGALSLAVREAF